MSDRAGLGFHVHTAGSQSYDEIRERIRREEGVEPSMHQKTHRRADGTYVDKRAQTIVEELQSQLESLYQPAEGTNVSPTPNLSREVEDDLYKKFVEPTRGCLWIGRAPSVEGAGGIIFFSTVQLHSLMM